MIDFYRMGMKTLYHVGSSNGAGDAQEIVFASPPKLLDPPPARIT